MYDFMGLSVISPLSWENLQRLSVWTSMPPAVPFIVTLSSSVISLEVVEACDWVTWQSRVLCRQSTTVQLDVFWRSAGKIICRLKNLNT